MGPVSYSQASSAGAREGERTTPQPPLVTPPNKRPRYGYQASRARSDMPNVDDDDSSSWGLTSSSEEPMTEVATAKGDPAIPNFPQDSNRYKKISARKSENGSTRIYQKLSARKSTVEPVANQVQKDQASSQERTRENPRDGIENDDDDDDSGWFTEFWDFLRNEPHGAQGRPVSENNAKQVLRQIKLLANGEGIEYKHWPEHRRVFCGGRKINWKKENLTRLFQKAKAWEDRYGEDKGHGWLLRHPITKLRLFQEFKGYNWATF